MSRSRTLALAATALILASTSLAQERSQPGAVSERNNAPMCQASGGGSRMRANCETESVRVRTEQEIKIRVEVPGIASDQCEATSTTEYQQRNTVAHLNGTISVAECPVASGTYTVAVRIRNDAGEEQVLEFPETWQRSDGQDATFTAEYPIGENMELRSVRIRNLRCTCGEPAAAEAAAAADAAAPQ